MKKKHHHGFGRFDFFLNQLEQLFSKAVRQKNPALWLYRNNARTPLFMLEALSRACEFIYKEKRFVKLYVRFKQLEDMLGAIDYYDAFAREFSTRKQMPKNVVDYLHAMTREKVQSLNEILKEKKWIVADNSRIEKIRIKLAKTDWLKEEDEIKALNNYYKKSIDEITKFSESSAFHFENIETDVHELRRKLRWLSIYPQAFRGNIQLTKTGKYPDYLKKYLTKEITTSAFNKMPDANGNRHFLLLDQNYFYALSWMIAELGRLKDNGLRVIVIKEALQQESSLNDAAAIKKSYQLAGKDQQTIPQLLKKADEICKKYFSEKNLDHLVIGISHVK